MTAVVSEPLSRDELRLIASLYPNLSPSLALATYRAWIAQGFAEIEKFRFRADRLGE